MIHAATWQATDTTDTHNKYYRVYVAGSVTVIQYGRIGTAGSARGFRHQRPTFAIDAATEAVRAKTRSHAKGYVNDGPVVLARIPTAVWDNPGQHPHELDACYQEARATNRTLRGSLTDGQPHVVAIATLDGPSPIPDLANRGVTWVAGPGLGVHVGVLDAAACAYADDVTTPRVALMDLGVAQDADTADVLQTALRLWTPNGPGPQAHLAVCVDNARMIHLPV